MAAAALTLAVVAGAARWARPRAAVTSGCCARCSAALCVLMLVVLASALKRLGLYEEAYGVHAAAAARRRQHALARRACSRCVVAALARGGAGWLPRAIVRRLRGRRARRSRRRTRTAGSPRATSTATWQSGRIDGTTCARSAPTPRRRSRGSRPSAPECVAWRHRAPTCGRRTGCSAPTSPGPARGALTGLPAPQPDRLPVLGSAPVRDYYEGFWADAPADPEPWAWRAPPRAAAGRGAARRAGARPRLRRRALRRRAARRRRRPGRGRDRRGALARARAVAPGADLRLLEPDGSIPLEHGSVDLVWCSEVLEHVADGGHLLQEARRVLRPGGRILVTVPVPRARQGGADRAAALRRPLRPAGPAPALLHALVAGGVACAPRASRRRGARRGRAPAAASVARRRARQRLAGGRRAAFARLASIRSEIDTRVRIEEVRGLERGQRPAACRSRRGEAAEPPPGLRVGRLEADARIERGLGVGELAARPARSWRGRTARRRTAGCGRWRRAARGRGLVARPARAARTRRRWRARRGRAGRRSRRRDEREIATSRGEHRAGRERGDGARTRRCAARVGRPGGCAAARVRGGAQRGRRAGPGPRPSRRRASPARVRRDEPGPVERGVQPEREHDRDERPHARRAGRRRAARDRAAQPGRPRGRSSHARRASSETPRPSQPRSLIVCRNVAVGVADGTRRRCGSGCARGVRARAGADQPGVARAP